MRIVASTFLAALWLAASSGAPAAVDTKPAPAYDPTRPSAAQAAAQAAPLAAPAAKPDARPAEAPAKAPEAAAKPATRAFLWRVKSPTNVVYLFGTIHVGKRSFYPLPAAVEEAIDQSPVIVVEADVTKPETLGELAPLITYTAPDSLDKNIPKPLFERLKAVTATRGIPEQAIRQMKPFVVGGFLSVLEFSRLGYDMNRGVDAYLIARARESGKRLLELEGPRAQVELLAAMPADLQEAFLDNALVTLENGKGGEQVTGMVNAWQSGDPALMEAVVAENNKELRLPGRFDELLLHNRHPGMVAKIEGYLAGKEPHFVAVGGLHLIGPKGLVAMLKAKGYEVTQ